MFEEYTTAEDPTCGDIDVFVDKKNCAYFSVPDSLISEDFCIELCGDLTNCKRWGHCDGCPFWAHSYSIWTKAYTVSGKGTLKVLFKNVERLAYDFEYGPERDYELIRFISTEFVNKDYTSIVQNDMFDVMEAVGISVLGTTNEVAPLSIWVKFVSDRSQDTISQQIRQSDTQGNYYTYSALLEPGFFSSIVGDPESLPWSGIDIRAIPVGSNCTGKIDPNTPIDHLRVTNFRFAVAEISFLDDYQLYRDSLPISNPVIQIPIIDPVWIIGNPFPYPVAYRRYSPYNMTIVVRNDHYIYHDFDYRIQGACHGSQHVSRYSTEVYTGHLNGMRDTLTNIIPAHNGHFPDSVGFDDLDFTWSANKTLGYGIGNYRAITESGTHRVYFTKEDPLIDTVNVLGLKKICTYANGEFEDTTIAKKGVKGVYAEGWDYEPGIFINPDPLHIIRYQIGQCGTYANLLVYLYNSIGIPSHGVVIYDGADIASYPYYFQWFNTITSDSICSLWSGRLKACDGEEKQWDFWYHAVAECANHYCDASLGLFKGTSDYEAWWRYYVYPQDTIGPYLDNEPPPMPPYYYHHLLYILPSVYPTNRVIVNTHHHHP
ncbi:MAG TPA: hypothetical protein DEO84_01285 [candidate division Zixibacteria bacterium]|nr:hypothetical protein [candidate division Zixibacteria bacterium]HBY99928.1 hypothetical protein [candidate division Zixibacteria bacterium]